MTNAVATLTGAGTLAAAGASSQGAATIAGSGVLAAVAPASGNSIATIAGTGAAAFAGAGTGSGTATIPGAGTFAGLTAGSQPGVATITGVGVFAGDGSSNAASPATLTGVGVLNATGVTSPTAAAMSGRGLARFSGAWSNLLPFNYPPSWSINIYGKIIEAVGYDPTTRNLKIIFSNSFGQFIIIGPYGISITNQIELSSNPEAYVLALIPAATGPRAVSPPPPPPPPPPPSPAVFTARGSSSALFTSTGPPPTFSAAGVNFDGTMTYLQCESLASTDNAFLSFSFWFRFPNGTPFINGGFAVWDSDIEGPDANFFEFAPNPSVATFSGQYGQNSGSDFIQQFVSGVVIGSDWHHYIASADASGSGTFYDLLDGSQLTLSTTNRGLPTTIQINGFPFNISGIPRFFPWDTMDMAEFWFSPGQSLLSGGIITPTTLELFNIEGAPVNLGTTGQTPTGTSPAVYLHRGTSDAPATFGTNLGTGGDFTINGVLTASGTNP